MQNLLNELKDLLKTDTRFISDGELLKNAIIESALRDDAKLLELLLSHNKLKSHFFTEIKKTLIFKKDVFLRFVNNKHFLPDSYTSFKNKVGLTLDDEYLSGKKDVVLSFPYKDCILEGGQTKEEVNGNRPEVFWNEILAPDEVDRLLEPKVLTNFKRINSKGEHKITEIKSSDNLIIKGNNLLALHSLKKKFTNKIKLIYIDPPYNTGNDSFTYNDRFNHSSWLTFMKNRLEVAKELLTNDGSIFISIDQNELGYLLILMDEIFGQENRRNIVTVKRSAISGAKVINPGVVNVSEHIVIYSRSQSWNQNRVYKERERDERYNIFVENVEQDHSKWRFITILDAFSKHTGIAKSKLKKNFGENYKQKIDEFVISNINHIIQFANLDEDSVSKDAVEIKKKSLKDSKKVFLLKREGKSDYYIIKGKVILFYKERVINVGGKIVPGEPVSDIWIDVLPNDLHSEGGVKLRKGKKPEKLIGRIIEIGTNKGDLLLDFFVGSGTTCAVAHKFGRQYIGIEQIDYEDNSPVTRLKNTIKGEQSGVSKSVNWKGGGDFVYCELMQWNQKYVEQIHQAKNQYSLKKIWKLIQEKGFLSYKLDIKEFNKNISEFEKLGLNQQKEFLTEILDKNQLYVNFSEIDDKDFEVSKEDKELNKRFYGKDVL